MTKTSNPRAQAVQVAPIQRAKPLYSVRAANCSAPSTAPTPAALMSSPSVFAPPCRMSLA